VQTALFNALSASTTVQGVIAIPPRLYDHVPPGAVFPYVTFGAQHIAPYDSQNRN